MKGRFITFEGGEGSGKTTQIKLLAQTLRRRGHRVVVTREPGGTTLADRIRRLLLDRNFRGMGAMTELFLYEASRHTHVEKIIRPALQKGAFVLCDRFTDATLAYQGYARGLPLAWVRRCNEWATRGLKPDVTYWLDLPPDQGLQRARRREKCKAGRWDRLERESLRFHRLVRKGYQKIQSQDRRRVVQIAASLSPQEIQRRIWGICEARFL